MTVRDLYLKSHEIHKKNRSNSWILSFGCVVICSAALLLMLVPGLSSIDILLFPLFILPIFFACTVIHFGLKFNTEVSWKNIFRFFRGYYSPQFIRCYKVLKSFLKALLIALLSYLVIIAIEYLILRYGHPNAYDEFIVTFKELVQSVLYEGFETTATLEDLLAIGDYLIYDFVFISDCVTSVVMITSFMYFVFYRSISIYTKLFYKDLYFRFVDKTLDVTLKNNKPIYRKHFWALNWPFLPIMLGGGIASVLICNSLGLDSYHAAVISETICLFLLIFFLPFYWSNMEALADEFEPVFRETSIQLASYSFKKIDMNDDANQEKEKERSLDENAIALEEDRKKDSEES